MTHIHVDYLGPLPLTRRENEHIIIFVDRFTKWVEARTVPDNTAVTTAKEVFYDLIITRNGFPETLLSDRGTNFLSKLMKEVCKDVKIEPELLPVGEREMSGITQDKARLDVSGVGVWGTHERTFLDIKVFHPNCATYINMDLERAYVHHENIKN